MQGDSSPLNSSAASGRPLMKHRSPLDLAVRLTGVSARVIPGPSHRLAAYGGDIFRSGGADTGGGAHVFTALELGFAAWALVLLAIGIRAVEGWSWPRTVAATGLFGALAALADLALQFFG